KPIVGVTLDVEWLQNRREIPRSGEPSGAQKTRSARNDGSRNDGAAKNTNSVAMVLLAADMEGYSNLCQLATLRHLGTTELAQSKHSNENEGRPAEDDGRPVTFEELAEHSRGVIALCPLPARIHDADD